MWHLDNAGRGEAKKPPGRGEPRTARLVLRALFAPGPLPLGAAEEQNGNQSLHSCTFEFKGGKKEKKGVKKSLLRRSGRIRHML